MAQKNVFQIGQEGKQCYNIDENRSQNKLGLNLTKLSLNWNYALLRPRIEALHL